MGILVDYINVKYFQEGTGAVIDNDLIKSLDIFPPFVDNKDGFIKITTNKIDLFGCYFIPWCDNKIGYGIISPVDDFISTKFEGCYMAAYIGEDRVRKGFHIHRGGTADQKTNWNKHIEGLESEDTARYSHGILFKPNSFTDKKEEIRNQFGISGRYDVQTWGIISSNGNCYSVLVYKLEGVWRIETIEENTPLPNMIIP